VSRVASMGMVDKVTTDAADVGTAVPGTDGDWTVVSDDAAKKDPVPEQPVEERNPELDLCFLCDCTGSMGSYIRAAQQHICEIVQRISQSQGAQVRFALISYRDHPPQDHTYITQIFPFSEDTAQMKANVDTMSAAGGGDGPEAVTAALHDALHMPWRPNATKVAVLIADAPPHGLEPAGDGFPNGDPEGRDPLQIAREMADRGIACYSVGCEPALGGYRFARDFMCTLSEITGGQAVALSSASLLAEVIVNGSAEEISLTRLEREVEEEVDRVQAIAHAAGESVDYKECAKRASVNLQSRGVISAQVETDGGMVNSKQDVWHSSKKNKLSEVKAKLCSELSAAATAEESVVSGRGVRRSSVLLPMSAGEELASASIVHAPASAPLPTAGGRGTVSSYCLKSAPISEMQVERLMKRKGKY